MFVVVGFILRLYRDNNWLLEVSTKRQISINVQHGDSSSSVHL